VNNKLYYTPPSNKVFEDLRTQSISLLETISDGYYKKEKLGIVKEATNTEGVFMLLVSMFDLRNQKVLSSMVTDETSLEIRDRMIDGQTNKMFINF